MEQPPSTARGILGVSRVPFLALSVTLVAAGAAASAYDGGFHAAHTALALIGLVALHIAVNTYNEWSDFRRGIDLHTRRTPFSGGSGTLPEGRLAPALALAWAIMSSAAGAAIGMYFIAAIGSAMIPIVVMGAASVLLYTDVFARMAIGEVAAGLGLGALPVLGTALVQDGHIGPAAIAAAVPAFLMTFNLLLLNEFPDEQADKAGGRFNLVIALGRPAAARTYLVAAAGVFLSILVAVAMEALPGIAVLAVLPGALLGGPARWALRTPGQPVPTPALGANVIWILSTNTTLAILLSVATLL